MEDEICKAKVSKKQLEYNYNKNKIRIIHDEKKASIGSMETYGHHDTNAWSKNLIDMRPKKIRRV